MTQQSNEVKEIDLLELFKTIGQGIKNAFLSILRSVFFLIALAIKKIHFLALFAIIGAGIGLFIYSSTPRYYSSDLIAEANGELAVEMVEYINDLGFLCNKRNKEALAYSLNMPDSIATIVKNIEAFHYIDVNKDKKGDYVDFKREYKPAADTSIKIDHSRIYLRVAVYDNHAFNAVKKGIFNYINNNQFFNRLNLIRKSELQELISQTEKEIQKLDSLQNVDYFSQKNELNASNEGKLMFLSERGKQMFYVNKLSLLKQKQEYKKELQLSIEPLTIIKDFTHLTVAENPRSGYITKYALRFLLLGYIFILVLSYRKKIFSIIEK